MKAIVDAKEFKRVVKALKPFTRASNDKMQYIMLEINRDTQEIRAEALDGHRIAVEYIKCQADESFVAYIKPFTFMKTDWDKVEIIKNEGIVTIDMLDYCIRVKQPEGEWYQSKKLIADAENKQITSRIGINAGLLIDALKEIKKNPSGESHIILECRGKKDPVIIREEKDRRNIRLVLPMTFPDEEAEV